MTVFLQQTFFIHYRCKDKSNYTVLQWIIRSILKSEPSSDDSPHRPLVAVFETGGL